MGKKGKFLVGTFIGGAAILATSALLSPKVREELQKKAKEKTDSFSEQFPETVKFVKEKKKNITNLFNSLKENFDESHEYSDEKFEEQFSDYDEIQKSSQDEKDIVLTINPSFLGQEENLE